MNSAPQPSNLNQLSAPVETPSLQQALHRVRQIDAPACAKCSVPASPGARFCTDCGGSLTPDCPACSVAVPSGDFCQACGHWLLDGQCRFCYAALAAGARFCEACGCNQSGLVCRRCHTTGFFDFCTACGDPVSEQGQMLVLSAVESPELEQALQSMRQVQTRLAELPAVEDPPGPPPRPIASTGPTRLIPREALQALKDMHTVARTQQELDGQRAAQTLVEARAAAEQSSREVAEALAESMRQTARREAVAQVQATRMSLSLQLLEAQRGIEAILEASNGVTYPTPQKARRSLMQVRSRLAALGQAPTGWRCIAFGNVHDTPNECANPAAGGAWVL